MKSIWLMENQRHSFPQLEGGIKTDVAVIGGGLCGIITAYMLQKKGIDNILLEGRKIIAGNTKNTTAKITSQHNLIYSKILKNYGAEAAVQYAWANQQAVKAYGSIIKDQHISCSFRQAPAYLFALDQELPILNEFNAISCFKPQPINAALVDKTELPFPIKLGIKFADQAQFDPVAFINGIAPGLEIYEHTPVLNIDSAGSKKFIRILTPRGIVEAEKVVIATHFPFVKWQGLYFAKMHQERSYALCLEGPKPIDGMYLGVDKGKLSFREHQGKTIIGGAGHRTGQATGGGYQALEEQAQLLYPDAKLISQWSAQDCMTHDSIPYIGKLSPTSERIYTATGFNKWGMTSSMVSAVALCSLLDTGEHPYPVFSPQRHNFKAAAKSFMIDSAISAKSIIKEKIPVPVKRLENIPKGRGMIITYKSRKVGVYKSADGRCHLVSVKCPHLGCELKFNAQDLSWDCPCHGSRFDIDGRLLDTPSRDNIGL